MPGTPQRPQRLPCIVCQTTRSNTLEALMRDYGTGVNKTFDSFNKNATGRTCPPECSNRVCTHNTTDEERADHLLEVTRGFPGIRLVPLWEESRGPRIPKGGTIEDAELVTSDEAARRIREDGVRGFFVYAGKESHGTEEAVILDRDEPDQWPDTPDTLRVISGGEGDSDHLYYLNDGSVKQAKAKGEAEGAGSVRVKNWGVVAPGSIHHETEGIYHVAAKPGVATLSSEDLTEPFLPSTGTSSESAHTYEGLDDPDEDAVETVQAAIVNFRCHSETSRQAIEYFEDLRKGRNLREHGFIPDDSSNPNGCRHEANLSLASKLHGMLLMNGEVDRDRNRRLIKEYLAHIARQYPRTDRGQRRKLLIGDDYVTSVVQEATASFEHEPFWRWMRRTKEHNFTGEYSELTEQRVFDAVEELAGDGHYPTRREIADLCHEWDDSRTPGTYGKCLRRMAGRNVKQAHCGGNDYRYYPIDMTDPEEAIEVTPDEWL